MMDRRLSRFHSLYIHILMVILIHLSSPVRGQSLAQLLTINVTEDNSQPATVIFNFSTLRSFHLCLSNTKATTCITRIYRRAGTYSYYPRMTDIDMSDTSSTDFSTFECSIPGLRNLITVISGEIKCSRTSTSCRDCANGEQCWTIVFSNEEMSESTSVKLTWSKPQHADLKIPSVSNIIGLSNCHDTAGNHSPTTESSSDEASNTIHPGLLAGIGAAVLTLGTLVLISFIVWKCKRNQAVEKPSHDVLNSATTVTPSTPVHFANRRLPIPSVYNNPDVSDSSERNKNDYAVINPTQTQIKGKSSKQNHVQNPYNVPAKNNQYDLERQDTATAKIVAQNLTPRKGQEIMPYLITPFVFEDLTEHNGEFTPTPPSLPAKTAGKTQGRQETPGSEYSSDPTVQRKGKSSTGYSAPSDSAVGKPTMLNSTHHFPPDKKEQTSSMPTSDYDLPPDKKEQTCSMGMPDYDLPPDKKEQMRTKTIPDYDPLPDKKEPTPGKTTPDYDYPPDETDEMSAQPLSDYDFPPDKKENPPALPTPDYDYPPDETEETTAMATSDYDAPPDKNEVFNVASHGHTDTRTRLTPTYDLPPDNESIDPPSARTSHIYSVAADEDTEDPCMTQYSGDGLDYQIVDFN